jgi:hypothetical protein
MPAQFPMGTNVIYTAPDLSEKIGRVYGIISSPYQETPDIYIVSFPDKHYNEIHRSHLKFINTINLDSMYSTGEIDIPEGTICSISHEPFYEGQEVIELHKNANFVFDKKYLKTFWSIKMLENRPITNPLTNLNITYTDIRVLTVKYRL